MTTQKVRNFRIYTGFSRSSDNDVDSLALDVIDALDDNMAFPNLPVSTTDLEAAQTQFSDSRIDARKGGTDRTRIKNANRQVLIDGLITDALYCQSVARHDLNVLLTSGYEVISQNRTSAPLATPSIIEILNNISGQLTVRGGGVLNSRMYQARVSKDNGVTWMDMGRFNGIRRMVLQPLAPGTLYLVALCALGGSTGQSAWSNPFSCMAT